MSNRAARVVLFGREVGAVLWHPDRRVGEFEFAPEFLRAGLDLAPLMMPLESARAGRRRWSFPSLGHETFLGLPGLLADALPDRFGNQLIDAWLARQGRPAESFGPVERLCYTGRRAMGALEFEPAIRGLDAEAVPIEIAELVDLARAVVAERASMHGDLAAAPESTLLDLLRVGTSAGGQRAKAVVAWNPATGELRSGQLDAPDGFEHWLLKFDGIDDSSLGDPAGYGRIEYAYSLMAVEAGLSMTPCRLLLEGDRAHFMTRRFDRTPDGGKLHMQSLCAVGHFDYRAAGAYSYEQALQVARRLRLPYPDMEQLYRRAVFNVVARNQDDHTKNIAFLVDASGEWRLAPAFDVTYAHNPAGRWTSRHQMTLCGKRSEITHDDLVELARGVGVKRADAIVAQIVAAVVDWPRYASEAGVPQRELDAIAADHRHLRPRGARGRASP